MNARGTIVGLTRGAGRNHIIRAALESIAYQTNDLITSIEADLGKPLHHLRVDGGASENRLLMQFQADISRIQVIRPASRELTALGAAFLAGLAVGLFAGKEELKKIADQSEKFSPNMSEEERERLLDGWHHAVNACKSY